MHHRDHLAKRIEESVQQLLNKTVQAEVTPAPENTDADYASNIALRLSKDSSFASPMHLAEAIKREIEKSNDAYIDSVSVATPGFLNFTLKQAYVGTYLTSLLTGKKNLATSAKIKNNRFLVEYAHPNTHKEMHIGHMRTLITGEAIARLLESQKGKVFRANYQGDIGPHVAKAMYGVSKLLKERDLSLEIINQWDNLQKAQFLGDAYVRGNQDYETHKEEIDQLNADLYEQKEHVSEVYSLTRKWSLEYYNDFYKRFYTKFDRLFFESEMVTCGKAIVRKNIGKVFVEDNGAVIFPGERYGLHTRVFITKTGNPTYEGKEMCNGFEEHNAFPFDQKIHVVGSEQAGYFQVVFKALELIDPEKFQDKQRHISMGMVHLTDRKMSSRTGEILRVDWLLEQVKKRVGEIMTDARIDSSERENVIEQIAIGAVKYSVLKVGTGQDVAFDIEKSVSLEGDSGPYLQYTYARTKSVISKAEKHSPVIEADNFQPEERKLLRLIMYMPEVITEAAGSLSPNILCTYLFELAHAYNLFYQKLPILKTAEQERNTRLAITAGVGKSLKTGLALLGIEAPERM